MKEGGERTGTFEIVDVGQRTVLQDVLPRGYLRGFAFAENSKSFYYIHEPSLAEAPNCRCAYHHVLGTRFDQDKEIFAAGESNNLRLAILPGKGQLGFLVLDFAEKTQTDFYVWSTTSNSSPERIIRGAEYYFGPLLLDDGRILAVTDQEARNYRIVEVLAGHGQEPELRDVVPTSDAAIQDWTVAGDQIFVSYLRGLKTEVHTFDLSGRFISQLPLDKSKTIRMLKMGAEFG